MLANLQRAEVKDRFNPLKILFWRFTNLKTKLHDPIKEVPNSDNYVI